MRIFKEIHKSILRGDLGPKDVASEKEFRALLARERARVDRNGKEFSVIVLATKSFEKPGQRFFQLVRIINERIRSTDDVGWFEKDRLGILLPETNIDGAEKVACDIYFPEDKKETIPEFWIYNYPLRWFPECRETGSMDGCSSKNIQGETKSKNLEFDSRERYRKLQPFLSSGLPSWKRTIDVLAAGAGLLFLFPVFILVGAYIKAVSPGPVFFRQKRLGIAENFFTCLKFRTMRADADTCMHENHLSMLIRNSETPMNKLDANDRRIIPFGKILRKTGIDELPQLINVLRGEMSLIGPRPCLPNEAADYLLWHRRRFDIHPGLTGLWQVSGKNKTTFTQMIRFDVSYAKTVSIWRDLKILLKTVPAVIEQAIDK